MADPLPLVAAAERLRGKRGRPRTRPERPAAPVVEVTNVTSLTPRLVDVNGAGLYLGGLSDDAVRDLDARGILRRVRLPGTGDRDFRRCLYDVHDLDALIERMKDRAP